MGRTRTRIGLGTLGLLAGLGAPRMAAQSWALPAADPVGIARGGTGVAYGASLEAAALNPALLATLRENGGAYLAAGREIQVSQATLQLTQEVLYSSDRGRPLTALGAAWRVAPRLVLGLKMDEPFMRHATMPLGYTGRFAGRALDLQTRRMELQAGWSATPNWAFGASAGVTRIQYSWDNQVRSVVAAPGFAAIQGLMETDLHQEGTKTAPSYSLGFRWAPNSRWTLGGAYVGSISTTLPLSASLGSAGPSFYASSGFGPAPAGVSSTTQTLRPAPGSGGITLPGKVTLGLRQRVNQTFTWELDLRYVLGARTRLPGYPTALADAGVVSGAGAGTTFRNGTGANLMGELTLSKNWVLRLGAELDPELRPDGQVDPLVGGAKSAGFSAGFGYRVFGGELAFGYQYRQVQDVDSPNLNGTWTNAGYALAPVSVTRVEGMGHLWSAGFKRTF